MCLLSRSSVIVAVETSKYAQVTHYNASSYTGRFHRPVSRRGVIGSVRVRVVLVTVDMLNHDREDAKVPGAEAT